MADASTDGNSAKTLLAVSSADGTTPLRVYGDPTTHRLLVGLADTIGYSVTAYGVGTAYSLTNTAAAIDFGTTDPAIIVDKAGTYIIYGQVNIALNGATITTETATIKIRRTNNTAADVSAVVVLDLPVSTTITSTYGVFQIPPIIYTTTNTDDALALFASVSAGLGAGTVDATATGTSLVAVRLK